MLPRQPSSPIIGDKQIQDACGCQREGWREERKEGGKCSPGSIVIAAALWELVSPSSSANVMRVPACTGRSCKQEGVGTKSVVVL